MTKAKYGDASRDIHAAYSPIHVLVKALTGASNRHEFRECAAQFCLGVVYSPENKGGMKGL